MSVWATLYNNGGQKISEPSVCICVCLVCVVYESVVCECGECQLLVFGVVVSVSLVRVVYESVVCECGECIYPAPSVWGGGQCEFGRAS